MSVIVSRTPYHRVIRKGENMRLVTPPLIVEENDSFENDALDRKNYGDALSKYDVSRARLIPTFAQQLSMFEVT